MRELIELATEAYAASIPPGLQNVGYENDADVKTALDVLQRIGTGEVSGGTPALPVTSSYGGSTADGGAAGDKANRLGLLNTTGSIARNATAA